MFPSVNNKWRLWMAFLSMYSASIINNELKITVKENNLFASTNFFIQ